MKEGYINIVWCDDKIDNIEQQYQKSLCQHNCMLYRKARTSEELRNILSEDKGFIDAVIVDFNMSDTNLVPSKDTAKGFQWVHEHYKDYSPLPFYLYTGRDEDFIRKKYKDFEYTIEGDYFFRDNENIKSKRNRYFQAGHKEVINQLLSIIKEEVNEISTSSFRIRQEYSDAFTAIDKFGLDGDVFLKILQSDEGIDRYDLINSANPLRKIIEHLMSRLQAEGIIQYSGLNDIPNLLCGESKNSYCYSNDDYMHKSLSDAFVFFLKYTQDGSHHEGPQNDKFNSNLQKEFHEYLKSTKDVYIVKALAIICLDIIKWTSSFYDKYKFKKPFCFTPFDTQVENIINIDGKEVAIVHDSEGKTYFVKQATGIYKYHVGTTIEVTKRKPTKIKDCDYYAIGRNLDVKKPLLSH